MSITVTGSIATDHLMVFPGSFREQLIAERLDQISLSFLVDDLDVRRGGVAANIAFGLGCLGLSPALVGAVGSDFTEYQLWLKEHGVDTDPVRVSASRHTARFVCTTDNDQNQIASFYPGAMTESREIDLRPIVADADVVVIGADDPEAMLLHTEQCREHGFPFAADPSQQLATLNGPDIRSLVADATYLFTNEYEAGLLMEKTGWTVAQVLDRVGRWIVTLGADGVHVMAKHEQGVIVEPPPERCKADPTGAGDAFRAGYLAARAWDLGDERAAQLGCALATLAIEVVGTQEYWQGADTLLQRFAQAYGSDAAGQIAARLAEQERGAST